MFPGNEQDQMDKTSIINSKCQQLIGEKIKVVLIFTNFHVTFSLNILLFGSIADDPISVKHTYFLTY